MNDKLTPKQERFVQGLISGLSQRQAYIQAGYSTNYANNDRIDSEACKLFNNPKVFKRYKELLDDNKERVLLTTADKRRRIQQIAIDNEKDNPHIALKAYDIDNKMDGSYYQNFDNTDQLNKLDEILAAIKQEAEESS